MLEISCKTLQIYIENVFQIYLKIMKIYLNTLGFVFILLCLFDFSSSDKLFHDFGLIKERHFCPLLHFGKCKCNLCFGVVSFEFEGQYGRSPVYIQE